MIICGIDTESTGVSTENDRIIEFGLVTFDFIEKKPIQIYSTFINPGPEIFPLAKEAVRVNGIRDDWVQKFGVKPELAFREIDAIIENSGAEYIAAHNASNFDQPIIMAELARIGVENHKLQSLPFLDSRYDLPFTEEPISRRLNHLALDHGFINPFPHRAVFDVLSMLRIMSNYDIQEIINYSKTPWIIIRALVDYDNREKAKEARFSWEKVGTHHYPKMWIKKIKENFLEKEIIECQKKGFEIVRLA